MNQIGFWILGVLSTAFFTLLWRRLDTIEKKVDAVDTKLSGRIDSIDAKLNQLTGDFREFKGRTEVLLGFVPRQPIEK
jgi:tetrahydromethanopterin S-methyltransferase subunit G